MKIGILYDSFQSLENWELRIIDFIINNSSLKITSIIIDKRQKEQFHKSLSNRISEYLIHKQTVIEEHRYNLKIEFVEASMIKKSLSQVPNLELYPFIEGNNTSVEDIDFRHIINFKLDVILKLGNGFLDSKINDLAKNGVWYVEHGDFNQNRTGPIGFWETITKQPVVGVSLLKLTSDKTKSILIDKAYFNRHLHSFVKTKRRVLESSVSLVKKHLNQQLNGHFEQVSLTSNSVYKNNLLGFRDVSKYISTFYTKLVIGSFNKLAPKNEARLKSWTLLIGEGNFMNTDLAKINPINTPIDEFWADPFLFSYEKKVYVFFENCPYNSGKGKISCGRVQDGGIVDVIDVLEFDYHISFPYVFEEDGEIYLMPESSENRRLEIYKCIRFPDKWELYSTAFEGEAIVDSFIFIDDTKQKWLFLNKMDAPGTSYDNELYIYRIDSLMFNQVEPHKQNPVLIDSRKARNGGAIFKYKNEIYRPSQNNTHGIYGRALNINKIMKLTIDEYIEKKILTIEPEFHENMVATHHLHQIDGVFVIDAAFKRI